MVKHIVMWKIKEEIAKDERALIKANVKTNLEGLIGKIAGLEKIEVIIEPFATSTHDMLLVSEFASKEALKEYAEHPEHVYVANTFVRPYTCERVCYDWEK